MKVVWESYPLGDLCRKHNGLIQTGPFGSQLHQHDYIDVGNPVVMPKDIIGNKINLNNIARISNENTERLTKHKLKTGDIVLPRRGDIGKSTLITESEKGYLCGTGCLKITPPKTLDPQFFGHLFNTKFVISWLESNAVGATMLNLSGTILKRLPIPTPPLPIQQKIAHILSAYDDLIENNLKRIKLLEEMAQITYEQWFVRMKFPNHETTPIDAETGLPEGWAINSLGEIAENFDRKRIPLSSTKRLQRKGEYPYYGAASVLDHIDEYIFDGKYLLMGEDGTVITTKGTPSLQFINEKFWVNNHSHILQGTVVSTEFLFVFLSQYPIGNHITGAAQPKINQQNLNRIKIVIASREIMESFDNMLIPIFKTIFNLKVQSQHLKKARNILLPRLMTGMIDVNKIKIPSLKTNTELDSA